MNPNNVIRMFCHQSSPNNSYTCCVIHKYLSVLNSVQCDPMWTFSSSSSWVTWYFPYPIWPNLTPAPAFTGINQMSVSSILHPTWPHVDFSWILSHLITSPTPYGPIWPHVNSHCYPSNICWFLPLPHMTPCGLFQAPESLYYFPFPKWHHLTPSGVPCQPSHSSMVHLSVQTSTPHDAMWTFPSSWVTW